MRHQEEQRAEQERLARAGFSVHNGAVMDPKNDDAMERFMKKTEEKAKQTRGRLNRLEGGFNKVSDVLSTLNTTIDIMQTQILQLTKALEESNNRKKEEEVKATERVAEINKEWAERLTLAAENHLSGPLTRACNDGSTAESQTKESEPSQLTIFVATRDANDANFSNFVLWYVLPGTLRPNVVSNYNVEAELILSSLVKRSPKPWVNLQPAHSTILRVTKKEEVFLFNDIPEHTIPSILMGYGALVRIYSDLTNVDLYFLLANDSDEFSWEFTLKSRITPSNLKEGMMRPKRSPPPPPKAFCHVSTVAETGQSRRIAIVSGGLALAVQKASSPLTITARGRAKWHRHSLQRRAHRKQLASELKVELHNTCKTIGVMRNMSLIIKTCLGVL
ncbi:membrane alanyl aminopeptidase [Salvia divinorum]|uniref:Membrane alanyl aminopeptidase n=1 Tax=Salvia divinorum TaxID=28513 RepID=A0ABD1IMM2_SALDI